MEKSCTFVKSVALPMNGRSGQRNANSGVNGIKVVT